MKIGIEWEGKTVWFYPWHWLVMFRGAKYLERQGRQYRWRFKLG